MNDMSELSPNPYEVPGGSRFAGAPLNLSVSPKLLK